jgi:dTMP kinase
MVAGRFIVIEGIDCSGSTTQTELLRRALAAAGLLVRETKEPTDSATGRLIRSLLARTDEPAPDAACMALLFAADRVHHCRHEIEPLLRQGVHVACDRYLHSSLAYQGVHVPRPWIREINSHALIPDLTIFLDVPVQEALRRLHARGSARDLYESEEMLHRVNAVYRAVLEDAPEVVVQIDGTQPIEVVHEHVLAAAWQILPR